MPLDVNKIRSDFPILHQDIKNHPLVYLDSAASTQKPQQVIDSISHFYQHDYANIHRAVHTLSQRATKAYESARTTVKDFINAPAEREVIFVRGATEGINLVASSLGLDYFQAGDEIVVSEMEHHSNIVPWQLLAKRLDLKIKVIPLTESGTLDLQVYAELLTKRTRLVSIVQMSNSLGTINPVKTMVATARDRGILTLVDGAQSVPHMAVDVQELGCDFFVFSGHKAYGPSGIGVLWGRSELLDSMPPYQSGGDMILSVSFSGTEFNELPYKFEAGTPHISGAVGLARALEYLNALGWESIHAHEGDLLAYGTQILSAIEGLRIYGTAPFKGSILSFVLEGVHPHDVGTILDQQGIAVRTGHHCTQPIMEYYGIPATTRASLGIYNTRQELDALAAAVLEVKEMMT